MKSILGALLAYSVLISFYSIAGPPKDSGAAVSAAEKSLEAQLACTGNPEPGKLIREMLAKGLLKKTKFDQDGIPVLAPTLDIYLYGKKVRFVSGWEMENDGSVKKPFERGPGTAPPRFIAVLLDANPRDVNYTARPTFNADGKLELWFSTIEQSNEYYAKSGTTITCFGKD